jgi:serine/threonine protein kinase
VLKDEPYNQKTDVWALGCILYELCTLNRAFDADSEDGFKQKILGFQIPQLPASMKELSEVYTMCM